jgi:hypothetical protein
MKAIPFRRVVPAGYEAGTLELTGTASLLMNSGEVDRESEEYRAYSLLGKKRGKSLDDEARLREMEWALGLYLDEDLGPYIPGKNVHEMLRKAATKWKKGEDVKRSLIVVENRIQLDYAGPRDQQGLWDEGYRYTAMVANAGMNRGRVVRCRACFDDWSLVVELAWDPEDLDFDTLESIVERSQKYGLGDYRPTFGAFMAKITKGVRKKDAAKVNGHKVVSKRQARAHKASVDRVKV